ncbi:MAG: PAS domain-containing protein, partial [Gemmatimonadetes bacterium]|nr:PAS domain-containing protein [Gemmatimonadota bacterium]
MSAAAVSEPRLVVGVGASAGGLDAFRTLVRAVRPGSAMTFLLVQHLDPTHKSLLAELLSSHTTLLVQDATHGTVLEPDTVYVIAPDTALAVRDGRIELSAPRTHRRIRLPVDHLFRSLAREFGPRAVGVVLSGAGSDGTAGVREIKAVGGLAIAQKPEQSGQPGMPSSAIDTGLVDLVLGIDEIPDALERFASLPPGVHADILAREEEQLVLDREQRAGLVPVLDAAQLARLSALLEAQQGFDLRVYKTGTIQRRVLRRMVLSGFESADEYFGHLRDHPAEQQTLLRDLLISVTEFFRDTEAFETLRHSVVDPLVRAAPAGTTLRVWVAGCATGEEAYSLGMEFLEAIDARGARLGLQIFATDVDAEAIGIARGAEYPLSIADQVSPERLERFFQPLPGRGFRVRQPLRETVSFALHDLTKNPPFSRMHLVSCRNVLIYLTAEAQRQVLRVLHFALHNDGYLFLGPSESHGAQRELFSALSKSWRIYRKTGPSTPLPVERGSHRLPQTLPEPLVAQAHPHPGLHGGPREDRPRGALLDAWVPPSVVVGAEGSVLYMHGELGPFLAFPQGDNPTLELLGLLRSHLLTRTRSVLYRCRREGRPVVALSSPTEQQQRVRITAHPAPVLGDLAVAISFELLQDAEPEQVPEAGTGDDAVIEQLAQELDATRQDLRSTIEELETSNEELRSSNEESMSMNEELQSANEELEATTEELRSLNEELTTVNSQLREKIDQLEQAHDDLHNFFTSTKVATIFLDDELRIKRFTPAAAELLGIDHTDLGRFVSTMARDLLQNGLEAEARHVLDSLNGVGRELRSQGDRWYDRRILPYRTESRRIEGIVVTFTDITAIREAAARLQLREQQQALIARMGVHALRESNLQGFLDQAVRDVQQTLGTDFCKILEVQPGGRQLLLRAGVGWAAGYVGERAVGAGPDSQAGYTLEAGGPVVVEDLAQERRFSGPELLRDHGVVSGVSAAIRDGDNVYGVLGVHTRRPRTFTTEDAHFVAAVAGVVGAAIGRFQTRRRHAIELGVSQVLAGSGDVDTLLDDVLRCFAKTLDTPVGELWWRPDADRPAERRILHTSPPCDRRQVLHHLRGHDTHSTRMVEQALEERRARWWTDLGRPSLTDLVPAAEPLGLQSALTFPVFLGGNAIGVVRLFAARRLLADPLFLHSLENIGRAVGDFVGRADLHARARRLAAITESSHDAILSYDLNGIVTDWLAGAEALFGFVRDDIVGTPVYRIVPEERRKEIDETRERIRRGEVMDPYETVRLHADGSSVDVSVRSSAVRDEEGAVVGVTSTDRDISRLLETERVLKEADRQKDQFLAMLGHELRNPLTAIRAAADLIGLQPLDPALQRAQQILQRQTHHMARLLDGLLDVSRIVNNRIALERRPVDLAAVCREVLEDVRRQLGDRPLDLRSRLSKTPVWVFADRVRMVQIVDNLISNAVKYTEDAGVVQVTLSTRRGHAILRVTDTGIGIDAELLPHVFDVFRQSQQGLARSAGGLGLGLALVRSLVELHEGEVTAKSGGSGRGSEFEVRLPLGSAPARAGRPAEDGADARLRLVLIEDNPDAADVLRELLEQAGHEVAVATQGRDGITAVEAARPDVVLCDLGLPDIDGFEVARSIRSTRELTDVRLIALSGYGRAEDRARALAAG